MKDLILAIFAKDTWHAMDVIRLQIYYRDYMREVATKMGIDTKQSYWSRRLEEKSAMIHTVWAAIDLIKEYITITGSTANFEWKPLLTTEELGAIAELTTKMQAAAELDVQPSFEEVIAQCN